ncbi:tRNA 2-selenouridine(34) synthase MnmH [Segetibacter koreensis]|uniref:tRNA 2-selenouridine(34) synthase MnmH n=1 Tax=Segetibacter koreensis TaxID=398037 RepID=UPI000372EB8C|nr:tRNA 2-selenouridine(34) synthase MnmH [Segetibacter koreensis]
MAIEKITIQQFFELAGNYPVLDVRSPGEYEHAHIPGAYSLPLFSDEERKVVGTAYKQESKQKAIKKGLQYFGVKMVQMVDEAERIFESHKAKKASEQSREKAVIIHCWRGGMRSAGAAWLLDLYGFKVYTIIGGYKSFRRWCAGQFNIQYPFKIIGGYTGSGKTETLKALALQGSAVIDLEALAHHKGSAFGHLGENTPPSQEMFENKLAIALSANASAGSIWLEDESQRIGSVSIPNNLYSYIQTRPVYFLEIPFEERLKYIVNTYGRFEKVKLAESITRITKRLGGLETKTALELLEAGNVSDCFKILLKYYDKYYLKCLEQKKNKVLFIKKIPLESTHPGENATIILEIASQEHSLSGALVN